MRPFSCPKQTSVSSMFSSSVRSFSSLPCHATFPTHDTVDKDTVEMDIVAMDIDMDVADMDLVVLGNTTGPLVHYWVRDAKCTWSSYENSYKFEKKNRENLFAKRKKWQLGIKFYLAIAFRQQIFALSVRSITNITRRAYIIWLYVNGNHCDQTILWLLGRDGC